MLQSRTKLKRFPARGDPSALPLILGSPAISPARCRVGKAGRGGDGVSCERVQDSCVVFTDSRGLFREPRPTAPCPALLSPRLRPWTLRWAGDGGGGDGGGGSISTTCKEWD